MKIFLYSLFFIVFLPFSLFSQIVKISGYVRDAASGEALPFSTCAESLSKSGAISNAYGFYSLSVQKGKVNLSVSYLGYETLEKELKLDTDTVIHFHLVAKLQEIEEVTVNALVPIREQVIMGKTMIPIQTIKAMPSFVGEPDLMKTISFIPGVSVGREGLSNIYVRGGDRGQNLILLDGMKLYNSNHVGGFLSLFNSNIIKHVDVYKGGFPSRYGGSASSVLDIYTRDGNNKKFSGKLNLGLINSSLLLEGPIGKRVSYLFAARSSYMHLMNYFSKREYKKTGLGSYSDILFYDINAKVSLDIGKQHKLALSFFMGKDSQEAVDFAEYTEQFYNQTNHLSILNDGISLIHTGSIGANVFVKNSLSYSIYRNKIEYYEKKLQDVFVKEKRISTESNIEDITFQSRWEIHLGKHHQIQTGVELNRNSFLPGLHSEYTKTDTIRIAQDTTFGYTSSIKTYENSFYLQDEFNIWNKLRIVAGVRGTFYSSSDTNSYFKLEPRVSLRWMISPNLSLKANYTVIHQYNHVLVNTYGLFEKEIWLAATKKLPPQRAEQFSLGFFYANEKYGIDVSVEGFYKKMSNLLEYSMPIDNEESLKKLDDFITKNGQGRAYGVEFQMSKNVEEIKLKTELNYTLSWSNRQFDGLNNGEWFPFIYDRRHNLSLLGIWQINKKYSLSANFVLSTGASATLPIGFSKKDDVSDNYFIYGSINNRKLPLYHRLDLAVSRKHFTKKGNIFQVSFNIYNVYARQNPVYLYYDNNTGKVFQKSIFPILPTFNISYEF